MGGPDRALGGSGNPWSDDGSGGPDRPGRRSLITDQDDARLWRVVDVFRIAALGYAVVLYTGVQDEYRHRWAAWGVLGVLAAWTALLTLRPAWHRREPAFMIADLVIAVGAVLSTRLLDDPERIRQGAQTLPSIWPAAAVLGWAIWRGWRGGLFAGLVISAADLAEVGRISQRTANNTANNIVLLVLVGLIVGYATEVVRAGRAEMAAAVAQRAANQERERLARDIHDSVLQVLGFVHRDGASGSGAASELARLAGEQEVRLRMLISHGPIASTGPGQADLRAALSRHVGGRVSVSSPAEPVLLPGGVVEALAAATTAALDNVQQHAGPDARAWVLLEDEPGQVTVTVRDDGPGLSTARLEAAQAEGRLGVSASIRGRIEEIGGTVEIIGRLGEGTEVEMRVPREPQVEARRLRWAGWGE
jgi:signal transduction histidine kinase